jgi:hypothetical protein
MPLGKGTHIQDSTEIVIPQDNKVTTKESREVITPQDSKGTTQNSREIIIPQDKVITKDGREIITPQDSKVTSKDSREIIVTQTKGALHKEIGGIMNFLVKEITGETTGIILPPMVVTMGKVEIVAMDNVTQVNVRGLHKWSRWACKESKGTMHQWDNQGGQTK